MLHHRLLWPLLLASLLGPGTSLASEGRNGAEQKLHRCIELILAVEEPTELDRPRPVYRDCPHLPLLEGLTEPLGITLPEGHDYSLSQLLDIRDALESRRQAAGAPLDQSRLQALLKETLITAPPSLWERFLRWLNEQLPGANDEDAPEWLEWLNDLDISKEQSEFIFNLSLTLLILMALGILFNELRRLPWSRARQAQQRHGVDDTGAEGESIPEWASIRQLPPREQAAALLLHLLRLMQERGVLPEPRARTARECVERVGSALPDERTAFAQVADAADRGLFGPEQTTAPDEKVFAEAEGLRQRLSEEKR